MRRYWRLKMIIQKNRLLETQPKEFEAKWNFYEHLLCSVYGIFLLAQFNSVIKKLQASNITIPEVIDLYNRLIKFLRDMRNDFDIYEKKLKKYS